MRFITLLFLISCSGVLAAPKSPSALSARDDPVTCADPSGRGKGGSRPIPVGDIDSWVSRLSKDTRKYCAAPHSWVLVGQACGANAAAVWLETNEYHEFCLTGKEAAGYARGVINYCEKDGQLYGFIQAGTSEKRWVEVAQSTGGCKGSG